MKFESFSKALQSLFDGYDTKHIAELGYSALTLSLLCALLGGLILAWAYSTFYGSRATGSNVHRAFPLIALATCAIFICVQFSLPLSLGLLGALSIVRFRTPIKEPEEIGFIMLVVSTGLCSATFNVGFMVLILAVVMIALVILRWHPPFLSRRAGSGTLVIRCSIEQYHEVLPTIVNIIERHVKKPSFDSVSTQSKQCILSWSFEKITPIATSHLEQSLTKELPDASIGIYFSGHANV